MRIKVVKLNAKYTGCKEPDRRRFLNTCSPFSRKFFINMCLFKKPKCALKVQIMYILVTQSWESVWRSKYENVPERCKSCVRCAQWLTITNYRPCVVVMRSKGCLLNISLFLKKNGNARTDGQTNESPLKLGKTLVINIT